MKYLSDLNWWKQFALNVGGVLTAVISFLSVLNIHYKFLTVSSVNSVVDVIVAVGTLVVGSLASIFNTYLTKNSKEQAKAVAEDYKAQQQAEEDSELAKFQAKLDLLAQQKAAAVTPSTEGPVESTQAQ